MTTERYFSVCTLGEVEVSDLTNISMNAQAGAYDTTRNPQGAICISGGALSWFETPPFVDAASTTTINIVFSIYYNQFNAAINGGVWFECYNATGTVVFRIRNVTGNGASLVAEYWNGATYTTIGAAFAITSASTQSKFHVALVCGASGSCTVHVNGVQKTTGSITSASMNNVAKCRWWTSGSVTGEKTWFTELAGANFDLRDLFIRYDAPTGNSATNTAWTGDYLNVDEADRNDTDMISSAAASDRETYTHAAYTLPGGVQIDSVWVAGRGRVNGAGPTDAKFSLRSGGTNYDSSVLALGAAFAPRCRYWAADPATSTYFTQTGYNNVEFGAVSV